MSRNIWQMGLVAAATVGLGIASANAAQIGTEGMTLLWHLDDVEAPWEVTDATTNGLNGIITGNARGNFTPGLAGPSAFAGFDGTGHRVHVDLDSSEVNAKYYRQDFTFIAWVRSPDVSGDTNRIIARGARQSTGDPNNTAGSGLNNPWQLWVDSESTGINAPLKFSMQNTSGAASTVATSASLDWAANTWYQIAVTVDYTASTGVEGSDNTAVVKLYRTIAGETSMDVELVASGTWTSPYNAALSEGDMLVIGAAPTGSNAANFPGGQLQARMDEVSFWAGQVLSPAQLKQQRDITLSIPEPASAGLIGAAGLILLAGRSRKIKP